VIVNFLKTLPEGVLENIQEVSIDMTKAYKTIVDELMPNSVITVDRFHVMKAINDSSLGIRVRMDTRGQRQPEV
jgi:transposase